MATSGKSAFGATRAPNEAWLAAVEPEPAVEPDLPIVDATHRLPDDRGVRAADKTMSVAMTVKAFARDAGTTGISWSANGAIHRFRAMAAAR